MQELGRKRGGGGGGGGRIFEGGVSAGHYGSTCYRTHRSMQMTSSLGATILSHDALVLSHDALILSRNEITTHLRVNGKDKRKAETETENGNGKRKIGNEMEALARDLVYNNASASYSRDHNQSKTIV